MSPTRQPGRPPNTPASVFPGAARLIVSGLLHNATWARVRRGNEDAARADREWKRIKTLCMGSVDEFLRHKFLTLSTSIIQAMEQIPFCPSLAEIFVTWQ